MVCAEVIILDVHLEDKETDQKRMMKKKTNTERLQLLASQTHPQDANNYNTL